MTSNTSKKALELVVDWNPVPSKHLAVATIEDDSLRDGLQGAYVRVPSLEEKKELLELSVATGCEAAMLGFPASSQLEFDNCMALIRHLEDSKLPCVPRFLSRAMATDLEPIARLNQECERDVWADFFIGSSQLRRAVESWSYPDLLRKVAEASKFCSANDLKFGISIEDATRASGADLEAILDVVVGEGVGVIMACDTVGASTPPGAAKLTEFLLENIESRGSTAQLWWHGHNDRGLAVANALASVSAGAHAVSGSFLGLGERTGNAALEQLLLFFVEAGNQHYDLKKAREYCSKLSEYSHVEVADGAPIIGRQAFATCTGTHASAVIKASAMGKDFEDLVFSSVPASAFGREQDILVGPESGLANIRFVLSQFGLEATEENAQHVLSIAKRRDRWFREEDIVALFSEDGKSL